MTIIPNPPPAGKADPGQRGGHQHQERPSPAVAPAAIHDPLVCGLARDFEGPLCPGCAAARPAQLKAERQAERRAELNRERQWTLPEARRLARLIRLHPGILRPLRDELGQIAAAVAGLEGHG